MGNIPNIIKILTKDRDKTFVTFNFDEFEQKQIVKLKFYNDEKEEIKQSVISDQTNYFKLILNKDKELKAIHNQRIILEELFIEMNSSTVVQYEKPEGCLELKTEILCDDCLT